MTSEKEWFYPPAGWPVHQTNHSWYERIETLEDGVRFEPNTICNEIDEAKISSKSCCSDQHMPNEDDELFNKCDIYKAARFVRGMEESLYPEMWEIEILHLDVFPEPGWAAYLSLLHSNNTDYFDWHHIFISSEEERQKLLDWFRVFKEIHGFIALEEFPVKIEYHKGERKARWIYEEKQLVMEYPDIRHMTDIKTGALVEVQLNPRFDEYLEFCRNRRLEGSCFTFNEEPILAQLEADAKWKERVETYRLYRRGRYQDDIANDLGVSQGAISKWLSMVRGELSRHMGSMYELFLKEKLSLRPDVQKVTHDGAKGKPDIVLALRDGSFEVISVKCFNTPRSTVTISIEEINPELLEAYRLQSQGQRVKLLVDYYNLDDDSQETKIISLEKPPKRLNFRR